MTPNLTIGINIKNRGVLKFEDGWNRTEVEKRPLENLLSCLESQTDESFFVRIVDWHSTDIDVSTIAMLTKLRVFVTKLDGQFNRSVGKNYLIDSCDTDYLFLIDADMIVPNNLIERAKQIMRDYTFWFPACRFEASVDGEILTDYVPNAVGNVCGHIDKFRSLRFKEGGNYNRWGNEDVNFFQRARMNPAYKILRDNVEGMIHQYHTDKERKQYDY